MRREFALVLLLGAAGAGLVVLAVRQAWAQAIFTPPRPLPAQDISVTGQQLVPLASALALAALACLAAVIATRSVARRAAGALLAVLGAGAAAAAPPGCGPRPCSPRPRPAPWPAPRRVDDERHVTRGCHARDRHRRFAGHAVMAGAPWRAAAVAGAVVIVLAGLATVWRGPRWPVMSARFDRASQRAAGRRPRANSRDRCGSR